MRYLIPLLGIILVLLTHGIDWPLAVYCKSHISPDIARFFNTVTKLGEAWLWYAFTGGALLTGLIHAFLCKGRAILSSYMERIFLLLIALLLSTPLVEFLKFSFGRARPRLLFECGLYGFNPFGGLDWVMQSFPSGHSQTIWLVMTMLASSLPKYRLAFFMVGIIVSLSRAVTVVHYFSDILVGALLGIAVALTVNRVIPQFNMWKSSNLFLFFRF